MNAEKPSIPNHEEKIPESAELLSVEVKREQELAKRAAELDEKPYKNWGSSRRYPDQQLIEQAETVPNGWVGGAVESGPDTTTGK